jgi:hypothetical protein
MSAVRENSDVGLYGSVAYDVLCEFRLLRAALLRSRCGLT